METISVSQELTPQSFWRKCFPLVTTETLTLAKASLEQTRRQAFEQFETPHTIDNIEDQPDFDISLIIEDYKRTLEALEGLRERQESDLLPERLRTALTWFFSNYDQTKNHLQSPETIPPPRVLVAIIPSDTATANAALGIAGKGVNGEIHFVLYLYATNFSKLDIDWQAVTIGHEYSHFLFADSIPQPDEISAMIVSEIISEAYAFHFDLSNLVFIALAYGKEPHLDEMFSEENYTLFLLQLAFSTVKRKYQLLDPENLTGALDVIKGLEQG
ncbi:MAG: hypothetical protein ABIE03_05865 [Patescibacteria group bacterium]|nr:hypothetical protein [Patescibacteria group bacterium]